MHRLKINKSVNITCAFTKDDWELYDMDGIDNVVKDLNWQLETFVNSGYSKYDVRKYMLLDMEDLSAYGTLDSKPLAFLDMALEEIFDGI